MCIFPTQSRDPCQSPAFPRMVLVLGTPDLSHNKATLLHNKNIRKFSVFILSPLKRLFVSFQLPEINFQEDLTKKKKQTQTTKPTYQTKNRRDFLFTFTSEFHFLTSASGFRVDKILNTVSPLNSWAGKQLQQTYFASKGLFLQTI